MAPLKVIFLDVDGVLNDHSRLQSGYCGIDRHRAYRLNHVLCRTEARIVLSSAWRYNHLAGAMTVQGLENLFLSHGLACHGLILGTTGPDHVIWDRGDQISAWLRRHPEVTRYCVLDDGGSAERGQDPEMGIRRCGHPWVRTESLRGLTAEDAARVIAILNESPAMPLSRQGS